MTLPLALGLLTLIVSVLWLPIVSAASTPRWIAAGAGAAVILVLLVDRVRWTRTHVVGALLLSWCALTTFWSVSPEDSAGALLLMLGLAAAFCVAAECRDLRPTQIALGLGATVSAVIMIPQMLGWHAFDPTRGLAGSPIGLHGNKNFAANFGALALIAVIPLWRLRWARPLVLGSAVCALLPMSRGAALALVAGAVAYHWRRGAGPWLVAVIVLTGCLLILDAQVSPERWTTSLGPRLDMWLLTATNLRIFGWGAGSYGTVFAHEHASGDILEIAFELGVGVALFVWLAWSALACSASCPTERALVAATLAAGLVSYPLHQAATAFVFAVAAGRIAGASDRSRRAELDSRSYCESSPENSWPLGAGALSSADLGRQAVPVRSRYPDGGGSLSSGSAGA